jgi:RHH-type transcriptional regulator, proline utilization regulon repressor / proline dehydrogenase / delta 1-pyrroline-5-carboxylate dehydrogenase
MQDTSVLHFAPLSDKLNILYRTCEEHLVTHLLENIKLTTEQKQAIRQQAYGLIEGVRQHKLKTLSVENFLQTYDLSSQEGLALMCLAEALLRVPDSQTQTLLIRDKIGSIEWGDTLSKSDTFFSKLTSLGLATTDALLNWGFNQKGFFGALSSLGRKLSEPVIRQSIGQAMKLLGHQFVMGETIDDALKRAQSAERKGYRHSYDMLGEGAKTMVDAHHYFETYLQAIQRVAGYKNTSDIFGQPSVSIKLSALHPRYELAQKHRIHQELLPKLIELTRTAKDQGIGLTIDAEESERLDLSLEIIKSIAEDPKLKGWDGFGLAVQAYQKRGHAVIDWIAELGAQLNRRFCVRLVKGAYWDSEIKKTQERGLVDYPVFTRKVYTDISYQACAQKMFAASQFIYPQFATHNAYTLATILELAHAGKHSFEFQRLHGMGEALYEQIVSHDVPCRVYAPVGKHKDLLAYLVRRLLENGANTSFVNKIYDQTIPIESMITDPAEEALSYSCHSHPKVPLPKHMFQPTRFNSEGYDLMDQAKLTALQHTLQEVSATFPHVIHPILSNQIHTEREVSKLFDPANPSHLISECALASLPEITAALTTASEYYEQWNQTSVETRAKQLEDLADHLEQQFTTFMSYLVYESGKTLPDANAEVREAIDFCRYYAHQARIHQGKPLPLPGPTGEINEMTLHGRGVFVCISPWNFPLAIFLGQVAAALVSGNCVIAKPAQQTPLVAYHVCRLAHQVGIPVAALQFLPAKGSLLGQYLLPDHRVSGVAFTGSTEIAWQINQTLAQRQTAIAPLIAETGGINAMIVDSTALPEQVVNDVITSAFQSAGQRCSALRLLFIQEEVADRIIEMLIGAMAELRVGHPSLIACDIGPVIDAKAQKELLDHINSLKSTANLLFEVPLNAKTGYFIAPQAWEIPHASELTKEVFGPILHIVRFPSGTIPEVMAQINAKGYGLTLGLHSRVEATITLVRNLCKSGNFYVNRSMIGAVVGVQPFGGEGLSGTGPKAGGPYYLPRFCTEHTFTQDTTAAGGNATLLATLG